MSVNFCRPELRPQITTTSVCSDGYGVDNLTNFNPFRGGWKGFMAESFIKPPVDITIDFPVNICIEKIVIHPCVGRQKSSGFEIYSATVLQTNDKTGNKPEPIATRIGNIMIPWASIPQGTCIVRFINSSYRSSYPDIARLSPQTQDDKGANDVERFLRMSSPGAVVNLNRLIIRVTRTYNGSVIALRSVEVWGEPSLRIPKQLQLKSLKLIQSIFTKPNVVSQQQRPSTSRNDTSTSKSTSNPNSKLSLRQNEDVDVNECPEDFVDPITCQMMILPVLLPSGHTIDRSTLDKHNKTEAVWGRPPNDPFTAVAFTSKSQPIPNVKLKTRLDQYLLTSGDKHNSIPRDVGRAVATGNPTGPSTSSLVTMQQKQSRESNSKHVTATLDNNCTSLNYSSRTQNMQNGTDLKRASGKINPTRHNLPSVNCSSYQSKSTLTSRLKRTADTNTNLSSRNTVPLNKRLKVKSTTSLGNIQASANHTTGGKKSAVFKSHEDSVSDSLDSALSAALGNLPSYSSTSSQNLLSTSKDSNLLSSTSIPSQSCAVCHVEVNTALIGQNKTDVSLYRLPCTHYVCRNCLMSKSSALSQQNETRFCASCGRTYRREDVVRVHV